MSIYQRRVQQLRIRMAMSGVLYVGFLIAAMSAGRIEADITQSRLGVMLLLLLGSMLLLPRSGMPTTRAVAPRTEEEADRQFMERSQLKQMEQLALYIRLGYLGGAVFVLFLVPRLFGGAF